MYQFFVATSVMPPKPPENPLHDGVPPKIEHPEVDAEKQ